jgi:hypothetical protein
MMRPLSFPGTRRLKPSGSLSEPYRDNNKI